MTLISPHYPTLSTSLQTSASAFEWQSGCSVWALPVKTNIKWTALTRQYRAASRPCAELSSHHPGCEVVRPKAPFFTVGFIILEVLLHDPVFRFKQEVAVRTGHRTAALVHWSERTADTDECWWGLTVYKSVIRWCKAQLLIENLHL